MTADNTEMRVDALSDALHRALAEDRRCWLLIDPTIRPLQAEREFDKAVLDRAPLQASTPTTNLDPQLMPWLVQLDCARAADSALIHTAIAEAVDECDPESLAQGAGRRICGWLESTATGAGIAQHISRHMILRRPGGVKKLLRWNDPAVLWAMWPILTPAQRNTLLGPISAYWLLDPASHWLALRATPATEPQDHLRLDADQFAEIGRIGALNCALLEWGATNAAPDALLTARSVAAAALRRAADLGFTDFADLTAFALRALTEHARFDSHPLVGERLAKRETDDYFTALVDDLTPEDWQRISTEGDRPTIPQQ